MIFVKFDIYRSKYPKLKLHIKGLEIMQDDPSMARVLYGDVVKDEGHDEVQKFGKELLSRLDNAGIKIPKYSLISFNKYICVEQAFSSKQSIPVTTSNCT